MKKGPVKTGPFTDSAESVKLVPWDRNRTGTPFLARDFKSLVSTSFTTRARTGIVTDRLKKLNRIHANYFMATKNHSSDIIGKEPEHIQ